MQRQQNETTEVVDIFLSLGQRQQNETLLSKDYFLNNIDLSQNYLKNNMYLTTNQNFEYSQNKEHKRIMTTERIYM